MKLLTQMSIFPKPEMPGFSAGEIQMIANVARYHRKREPAPHHDGYMRLGETDRERVRKLAAILRVADALDREHARKVKDIKVFLRPLFWGS